jgi:hypothetical protein
MVLQHTLVKDLGGRKLPEGAIEQESAGQAPDSELLARAIGQGAPDAWQKRVDCALLSCGKPCPKNGLRRGDLKQSSPKLGVIPRLRTDLASGQQLGRELFHDFGSDHGRAVRHIAGRVVFDDISAHDGALNPLDNPQRFPY